MKIVWSAAAWADLYRLYAFLAEQDLDAADSLFDSLAKAPERLLDFPRRGSRMSQFEPAEVREFRIGNYVLRYGLAQAEILVLRFFHAREDRF